MAYIVTPNSRLYLVKTKLESDYENTFHFANKQAQTDYFNSLIPSGYSFSDYTYIRKDGYVVVSKCADELIGYNYLFYENAGFPEAKRYYCFITKIEYVSENDARIYFETDVMQTYLYDLEFNRCFKQNLLPLGNHLVIIGIQFKNSSHIKRKCNIKLRFQISCKLNFYMLACLLIRIFRISYLQEIIYIRIRI